MEILSTSQDSQDRQLNPYVFGWAIFENLRRRFSLPSEGQAASHLIQNIIVQVNLNPLVDLGDSYLVIITFQEASL